MDAGLLVLRMVFGGVMAAHGAQKLFGWFGGYGLSGTGGYFESLGFRPGRLFAATAGLAELGGGLLIAIGLFGPVGAALVVATMIVAVVSVHWQHGLFAASNGIELALLYGVAAAAIALTGPGAYSLDAVFGLLSWSAPSVAWAAVLAGVVGGGLALAARQTAPQQVTA